MMDFEHSYEIRLAETKDVPVIAWMHKNNMKGVLSLFNKEIIALYYQNAIEDEHSCVMLAHEGENIVGLICLAIKSIRFHRRIMLRHPAALLLLLIKHSSSFKILLGGFSSSGIRQKTESELVYLFVTKDSRKRGVGSALFSEAVQYFRKKGVSHFYVVVEESNVAAVSFYEEKGMVATDKFMWNGLPQVMMSLSISG